MHVLFCPHCFRQLRSAPLTLTTLRSCDTTTVANASSLRPLPCVFKCPVALCLVSLVCIWGFSGECCLQGWIVLIFIFLSLTSVNRYSFLSVMTRVDFCIPIKITIYSDERWSFFERLCWLMIVCRWRDWLHLIEKINCILCSSSNTYFCTWLLLTVH